MSRRIGVMGGTFDPIHHGHLVAAEEARWQFDLDKVVFVPTGQPWQKPVGVSPAEDRYLMTVIATASNPDFTVSRLEIDHQGPTYTVDTLRRLRSQHPEDTRLFFITGADAVLQILTWKQPDQVLAQAEFIAATRPGFDLDRLVSQVPGAAGRVHRMEIPALAISSSDIRAWGRPRRPHPVPGARRGRPLHPQARPLPPSSRHRTPRPTGGSRYPVRFPRCAPLPGSLP